MSTVVEAASVPFIDMQDVYNRRLTADLQSSRLLVDLAMRRIFAAAFPGARSPSGLPAATMLDPPELRTATIEARTALGFRRRLFNYLIDRGLLKTLGGGVILCEPSFAPSPQEIAKERELVESDMRFAALREALEVLEGGAGRLIAGEDGLRLMQRALGLARAQALWERLTLNIPQRFVDRTLGARMLIAQLRKHGRATIIECGAGVGAVLRRALELDEFHDSLDRIERYVYTDINAFLVEWGRSWFSSRAPRALFDRMEFAVLDLDSPDLLSDRAESADIIVMDDVAHDVIDLQGTLRNLRRALKPGGWLALTEHFRQRPRDFFHFEFLPITLHSYNRGELDPPRRTNRGFMTLSEWSASLADAGFERPVVIPEPALHERWPIGGLVATR